MNAMKKSALLCRLFSILAILLFGGMCAAVSCSYCSLAWGAVYAGWSAPAGTAFLWVIPFAVGIALCALLARQFSRRAKGS